VSERADVIVDFTGLPEGTELFLIKRGPGRPVRADGVINVDYDPADPADHRPGDEIRRRPVRRRRPQRAAPASCTCHRSPDRPASHTRALSLNEMDSTAFPEAPTMGMLGLLDAAASRCRCTGWIR